MSCGPRHTWPPLQDHQHGSGSLSNFKTQIRFHFLLQMGCHLNLYLEIQGKAWHFGPTSIPSLPLHLSTTSHPSGSPWNALLDTTPSPTLLLKRFFTGSQNKFNSYLIFKVIFNLVPPYGFNHSDHFPRTHPLFNLVELVSNGPKGYTPLTPLGVASIVSSTWDPLSSAGLNHPHGRLYMWNSCTLQLDSNGWPTSLRYTNGKWCALVFSLSLPAKLFLAQNSTPDLKYKDWEWSPSYR